MQTTTALCLILWNERRGCEIDLPKICKDQFDEVFAIDGGSTDGSAELLKAFGIPAYRQKRPSLNSAYWQAVETTRCENIVVFFPKGTIDTAATLEMKQRLCDGDEMVIASRMIKGARNEEDSRLFRPRKWGVKSLALVSALLWRREGPVIWDILHGVKGFSKRAFLAMSPSPAGMTIDLEMAIRSYRLRIVRSEFPVAEGARLAGETRFKIFPSAVKLAKCLWREVWRAAPANQSAAAILPPGKSPQPMKSDG